MIEEKVKNNQSGFWIFLIVIMAIVIIGIIVRLLINSGDQIPREEGSNPNRSAAEIISELEGIQIPLDGYYQENEKYPIKEKTIKLSKLKSEVSGLSGYDDNRLKGAGGKDFLYQSNQEGSQYVIFVTIKDESSEIKQNSPEDFEIPEGYNYWVSNK